MPIFYCCHHSKSFARGDIVNAKGVHTFGGEMSMYNIKMPDDHRTVHLIYRLDLNDQVLRPTESDIRHLPLLLNFHSPEFIYRVNSDSEVEILESEYGSFHEPVWEVPDTFGQQFVQFEPVKYKPQNNDDGIEWMNVFGLDEDPFPQGDPFEYCENDACNSRKMSLLAFQVPNSPLEYIWPDEFVTTIWMTCNSCGLIYATNQCT